MLDIVAFTFLGGMVDAAVESNEYYQNFTVVEASDHSYVEIYLYDSFGGEGTDSYIRESGILKNLSNGEVPGDFTNILIDDRPLADYYVNYTNGRFIFDLNPGANTTQSGERIYLAKGSHFLETRFKDVDRTGVKEREDKAFSSSFSVGTRFAGNDSRELFINTVDFSSDGDVFLEITTGQTNFDLEKAMPDPGNNDAAEAKIVYSLDGGEDTILGSDSGDVRFDNETKQIKIADLKRPDGKPDKGEHTITFKYTNESGTYIGKHSFLVATDEWQNNDLGIDYSLKKFFLIGVLFWAFFAKAYEDTVNTIPDEAARGTIGFLITNHVNLSTLLISRYVSSSIKTFVIAMLFVFPFIAYQDIGNLLGGNFENSVFGGFKLSYLPDILLIILVMWVFMLVFSLLISSLNIMFKRILPFAMMMVTGLKVLTGYYFPLEALETQLAQLGGVADAIKHIPLVNGVYLIREIIVGKDVEVWERVNSMLFWTLLLTVFTMVFYKVLERKSRKWGTLEFY